MLLEAIQRSAFECIDLTQVLTMDAGQLRTFTLEQLERLRSTYPDGHISLWLSDQFLTSDRQLIMIRAPHPWLANEMELRPREELYDMSDDECRIAQWIFDLATLSHSLYTHEPFDPELLGDGLGDPDALYEDIYRYANQPMVDWIRTTPYRRVAAMVCYIMIEQETNWAVEKNQAVQDFYATECWGIHYAWHEVEDCEQFINDSFEAMESIREHYEKGHESGLNDEEIRVLDALYGFAPHEYFEEDFQRVRDICQVADKHLPHAPFIKSGLGQRKYASDVFRDLKQVFRRYDIPFDPSDLTDLTPGYLDAWLYDKYYNEQADDIR